MSIKLSEIKGMFEIKEQPKPEFSGVAEQNDSGYRHDDDEETHTTTAETEPTERGNHDADTMSEAEQTEEPQTETQTESESESESKQQQQGDEQQQMDGEEEMDLEDAEDAEEIRKATEALEKMKREAEERKRQRQEQRGMNSEKINDLEKRVESLEQTRETQAGINEDILKDISSINTKIEEVKAAKGISRTKKIKVAELPPVEISTPHKMLERVLAIVANNVKPYLYGKAGGGKSTLAKQVAECLHLPFKSLVISIDTTVQELVGYVSAIDGKYRTTPIRDAFENGGVLLLDEIDSASPEVLTCLNNLIENDTYTFPDGATVHRHENLRIIAAGNTNGMGGNATYNGRQKLDGATLDRFVVVNIPYDEELETKICGNEWWASVVQAIRHAVDSLGYGNIIISPRASQQGAVLLAQGICQDDVMDLTIYNKINDSAIVRRIKNAAVIPPKPE